MSKPFNSIFILYEVYHASDVFRFLKDIKEVLKRLNYEYCSCCFGNDESRGDYINLTFREGRNMRTAILYLFADDGECVEMLLHNWGESQDVLNKISGHMPCRTQK